jgi:hypothetical protein
MPNISNILLYRRIKFKKNLRIVERPSGINAIIATFRPKPLYVTRTLRRKVIKKNFTRYLSWQDSQRQRPESLMLRFAESVMRVMHYSLLAAGNVATPVLGPRRRNLRRKLIITPIRLFIFF